MIGPISAYGMTPINYSYGYGMNLNRAGNTANVGMNATAGLNDAEGNGNIAAGAIQNSGAVGKTGQVQGEKPVVNPGESEKVQPGKKSSPAECKTCKERKYQDGSNENVSFKSASHVSPESAGAAVRAHEQEHVANAYKDAYQHNGKVVSCSVSIHTAVCPECGRTYVSGGTTKTSVKYGNEKNPYIQNMKSQHSDAFRGANIDMVG